MSPGATAGRVCMMFAVWRVSPSRRKKLIRCNLPSSTSSRYRKPAPRTYAEVFRTIESAFGSGKQIHPVETVKARTVEDVASVFEKWVENEKAEGIVARSDSSGHFKVKPSISLDVAVLGFTESEERPGMIHDVPVGLMRRDNRFHILGRVYGGFEDEQRRAWLSDLKDMRADSNYSEVNDWVAYQIVRPEWVWEISLQPRPRRTALAERDIRISIHASRSTSSGRA